MNVPNLHLNLLRADEKASSSPVRLRVMLPVFALLLCAACAIWWGILFMRLQLVNGKVASLRAELGSKKAAHADILAEKRNLDCKLLELDQFKAYAKGRHEYGGLLAKLAEVIPPEVRLTKLEIPEPPVQLLKDPKNPKKPPLLGPTNTTESVMFLLSGNTTATKSVNALEASLKTDVFKEWFGSVKVDSQYGKNGAGRGKGAAHEPGQKPRGLKPFDVKCRCRERRFEK